MKKILIGSLVCVALSASTAFAQSFKVVCAGSSSYGPTDGTEIGIQTAQQVADSINSQLDTLSKTSTILAVSAPMTSAGTGNSSSDRAGGGASYTELVCVTVTLQ